MKVEVRKRRYSWFVVFCLTTILAIVAGNIWLLCCGRCVLNDYLRIPQIGWLLIFANLAAGLVLLVIKRRRQARPDEPCCMRCRISLRDTWVYCPNCGSEPGA